MGLGAAFPPSPCAPHNNNRYAWVGGWRAVRQARLDHKARHGHASLLAPALGGIVGFCLPAPDTTLYVNVFDLCALEEAGGFTRVAPGPVSISEILVNEYQVWGGGTANGG